MNPAEFAAQYESRRIQVARTGHAPNVHEALSVGLRAWEMINHPKSPETVRARGQALMQRAIAMARATGAFETAKFV